MWDIFVFVGLFVFGWFVCRGRGAFPCCLNMYKGMRNENTSVFMVRHRVFLLSLTHLDVRLSNECFFI